MRTVNYHSFQVLQRYASTIAGLFYGHTHQDEVRFWESCDYQDLTFFLQFGIGYSDNNNKSATTANLAAYIAGGVTPNGSLFPPCNVCDQD